LDFFKKRINCFFSHRQLLVFVANIYTKNNKKSSQKIFPLISNSYGVVVQLNLILPQIVIVVWQIVQVSLPWMSILGLVVTGSAGRNVKWWKLFEGTEFFRHKCNPA